MGTSVVVHATPALVAEAVAERLANRLREAQSSRGVASLVLTGGRIAAQIYARLADADGGVDWRRVDLWWGDERYLTPGHPDRNETQARSTFLSKINVDPDRVHAMPAAGGGEAEDAAAAYADELASASKPGHQRLPHFDVLLLGVGEDGHVASVFPELPAVHERRLVTAVRGSPKPPPIRITLTLPAINSAEEVWLIATGSAKAGAVAMALGGGAGPSQVPASGVHGANETVWFLDSAAAEHLPPRARSLR